MQSVLLVNSILLVAALGPAAALGGPAGVWVPRDANGVIARIHISGSPFNYTATIDYHCGMGICSTLQSLIEDNAHSPPTFSVPLEGVGPAPMLALRWQKGPPCNRATSDENPLAYWANAKQTPSGKAQIVMVGRIWCFVHPAAPHLHASAPHR